MSINGLSYVNMHEKVDLLFESSILILYIYIFDLKWKIKNEVILPNFRGLKSYSVAF